jgi:ATP/maltotriose-dependent transcriptional regulator MalT
MDVVLAPAGAVVAPTKLHVPGPGGALVPRDDALPQRLAAGAPLAVLVAPRATVAAWAAAAPRRVAWVALDPEDGDPVRLWRCAIAALRVIAGPGFGAAAEAILAAGPAALGDAVVPLVAAELGVLDEPVALVLDGLDALGPRAAAVAPSLRRWDACAPAGALLVATARTAAAVPGELRSFVTGSDPATEGARAVEDSWARTPGTPSALFDAALQAGQPAVAAAVVAAAWPPALRRGERDTVLGWMAALPADAAAAEPDLWLVALWAALERGDLAAAHEQVARAAGVSPALRSRGLLLLALDALRRGDLDATAARIDAAAQHDPDDGFWHTAEALLRAHESFWRGHPRVAHRHFARAAGLAAVHGDRFAMTAALGHLALLAAEGGDDDAARRRLSRLEDLGDADPAVAEHPVAIGGALAEGRLLELAGAYASAAAPLERAIALGERGAGVFERAEARLRLATVLRACHRPADAAPLEAEAVALLEGCADRGRLAGLAAAVAPAFGGGRREALTPAEQSVLRLLPSGLSQREIGGELFLSVNTVKTHCRNIYLKLHAGSREEAVARAHELGLL